MRNFFISIPVFFFFGFLSAGAQVPQKIDVATSSSQKVTVVATVGLGNIKFLKQENNVFTLAFDVSNRAGIQPEVIYSVKLLKKESNGFSLADQKVYDRDILSLKENESIHKEAVYTAPPSLQGIHIIEVEAKNSDGLPFSIIRLPGEIFLNGTGESIFIDSLGCFLTVKGEKGDKKYTLSQGVDISKEETLIAHCSISNTFKTEKTVTPVFETRYRSVYGKIVGTEKQNPITLKANQKMDFTALLPKTNEPQAYDAILSFEDEKHAGVSFPVAFHYVLQGESATIQKLTTDKASYQKGETAKVSFFWSGSADNFPGSRTGISDTENPVDVFFTLLDGDGNSCSESFNQNLDAKKQGGLEHFSIPITSTCQNPVVTAQITDQNKKVLSEKSYEINPKVEISPSYDKTLVQIVSVVILLLFISLFVFFARRRGKGNIAILLAMIIGVSLFAGGREARADSFTTVGYDRNGTYWSTFTASLDKMPAIYNQGENMNPSGSYTGTTCSNGDARGLSANESVVIDNVAGLLFDYYPQTEESYSSGSPYGTVTLKAPLSIGTYNAVFTGNSANEYGFAGTTGNYSIPYTVVAPAPVVPPPPIVTLTASPTSAPSGGWSTLTWATAGDVSSCTASGDWLGTKAVSGSELQTNITATKNYSIICTGAGGNSLPATATVTLLPDPVVVFQVSKDNGSTWVSDISIPTGSSYMYKFGSPNVTSCVQDGTDNPGLINLSPVTGTLTAGSGIFSSTVICKNDVGTSAQAAVSVTGLDPAACGSAARPYSNKETAFGSYPQCSPGTASNTTPPTPGGTATWTCSSPNGGSSSGTCTATKAGNTVQPPIISHGATPNETRGFNVISGQSVSFRIKSTDTENDNVRYLVDWDNNGSYLDATPDGGVYIPAEQYAWTSHTWSGTGRKTFRVKTQDNNPNPLTSSPVLFTVNVVPPPTFSCQGILPPNTTLHPGDTTVTNNTTPYTFSANDTAPQCQYHCQTGTNRVGTSCVPPSYSCVEPPPLNTFVYSGDTAGTFTQNLAYQYAYPNTDRKCEYRCANGYHLNGETCVQNCVSVWAPTDTSTTCTTAKVPQSDGCGHNRATIWGTKDCSVVACGGAAKPYAEADTAFSDNACSTGSVGLPTFPEPGSSATWTCGSHTCTATRSQNGRCGSANGIPSFMTPPVGARCYAGSYTEVTKSTAGGEIYWNWRCNSGSVPPGGSVDCSARKTTLEVIPF
ncbi:MAG: hypothetical protein NT098_04885 [Candidatus Parcubacteria bacterium]|nr:hypothetical protein [Candidatus Parcubacteria bacterium]